MKTNNNIILTMSVPVPNPDRSGYSTSIVSTFNTDQLIFDPEFMFGYMIKLKLKTFIIVTVKDFEEDYDEYEIVNEESLLSKT